MHTISKYYSIRHNVKPGITGWAQICYPYGASEEDALRKLEYDLYYNQVYVSANELLGNLSNNQDRSAPKRGTVKSYTVNVTQSAKLKNKFKRILPFQK